MVKSRDERLDFTFTALSHPIRRGILASLARGDASVGELAQPHGVSGPAITKHLRILERAGLLTRTKEGREHRCSAVRTPLDEATAWIERNRVLWNERLSALDRYLKENP
jgi:DNA-binding transcriptional ArsR family regulator